MHGERAYYGRGGKWYDVEGKWGEYSQPEELSLELPAEGVKDVRASGPEDFERQYAKAGGRELATQPQVQAPQRQGSPAPQYGDLCSCLFCLLCGGCCGICGICAWCTPQILSAANSSQTLSAKLSQRNVQERSSSTVTKMEKSARNGRKGA